MYMWVYVIVEERKGCEQSSLGVLRGFSTSAQKNLALRPGAAPIMGSTADAMSAKACLPLQLPSRLKAGWEWDWAKARCSWHLGPLPWPPIPVPRGRGVHSESPPASVSPSLVMPSHPWHFLSCQACHEVEPMKAGPTFTPKPRPALCLSWAQVGANAGEVGAMFSPFCYHPTAMAE